MIKRILVRSFINKEISAVPCVHLTAHKRRCIIQNRKNENYLHATQGNISNHFCFALLQ